MTVGKLVRVRGMDNGHTHGDNDRINSQHIVLAVPDNTHIDIGVQLTSYVSPNQPTNIEAAYILGRNATILISEYQCSFDFLIKSYK